MSKRERHGFFEDEQGDRSLARVLLIPALVFTYLLIVVDASLKAFNVPGEAWALLTALDMGLVGWAAGPRIARYLLPQVGAVVQSVGAAAQRMMRVDNSRKDDERGD